MIKWRRFLGGIDMAFSNFEDLEEYLWKQYPWLEKDEIRVKDEFGGFRQIAGAKDGFELGWIHNG